MVIVIDGKQVARKIKAEVESGVAQLKNSYSVIPGLAAILVGDDTPSVRYVERKECACERVGMHSEVYRLPAEATQQEVSDSIKRLNDTENIHGILVQLPLPDQLDRDVIMEEIDPSKDVDCLTPYNMGRLCIGKVDLEPCTPKGILRLMDEYDIPTEGQNVVIIGRSDIVGRPLSIMMSSKKRNATVTLCHSRTRDLHDYTREADILVAAIGNPHYVTADMVKEGAVIIDVGINQVEGSSAESDYRLVGDVDFESVVKRVSYITPVPGGVGPMTIASLMQNTLRAAELRYRK